MESATMRHRRKPFKLSRVFNTSVVGLILIDEMVRSCVLLGRRTSFSTSECSVRKNLRRPVDVTCGSPVHLGIRQGV